MRALWTYKLYSNKESSLTSNELLKDVIPQHYISHISDWKCKQVHYIAKDISMTNDIQGCIHCMKIISNEIKVKTVNKLINLLCAILFAPDKKCKDIS